MHNKDKACSLVRDGRYSESAKAGALALIEEDANAVSAAAIDRNIVSFSLFGSDPAYCETILLNAKEMEIVYPGWEMFVFHDETVPLHVLDRLKANGARLITAKEFGISHWPGTFWRFAAVLINNAKYVIFRDADSIISAREKYLVDEWIFSHKPFHIIRDWYTHVDLILAGLWGAYAPFLGNIKAKVDTYVYNKALHPTHADQHFLAQCIWPIACDFSLIHDSIHELKNVNKFEPPRLSPDGKFALGGYLIKKITFQSSSIDGRCVFTIKDNRDQTVCSYPIEFKNEEAEIELPYHHWAKIESRDWTYRIVVTD
jgi:hypothetical protein